VIADDDRLRDQTMRRLRHTIIPAVAGIFVLGIPSASGRAAPSVVRGIVSLTSLSVLSTFRI
jgi:hypothetical protein